jgi:hypothetical protein
MREHSGSSICAISPRACAARLRADTRLDGAQAGPGSGASASRSPVLRSLGLVMDSWRLLEPWLA